MTIPTSSDSPRLRLTILFIVVVCLFLALVARLWFLQVVHAAAARQQIQTGSGAPLVIYTPAPRGEILDRDGRLLVGNHDVPVIEVQKGEVADTSMVSQLAAVLGFSEKQMAARIDNVQYFSYENVPVYSPATPAQILYIQEHAAEFPGVTATTLTEPYVTPLGEAAGSLLGYVGPITATELAAAKGQNYQPGDIVGQTGVEAAYESYLRGKPGVERIQVDSAGRELGVLTDTPPVPGDNIRLTIDARVQQVAVAAIQQGEIAARKTYDKVTNEYFKSPGGSAVVLQPGTGQVLALATDPSYDPNLFDNGGISTANYDALARNPAHPLSDRATQGLYAPGSTFKLVTATAGMRYGVFAPYEYYLDKGYITIGGRKFTNDNGESYGYIDLPDALTVSSDNYFNTIGVDLWDERSKVGDDALQNVADGYGFNASTGIAIGDYSGTIPTPALYAKQKAEFPKLFETGTWYSGDSANTAIGQGEVLVTPLQLANAYASFANGGTLYQPQLALDAQSPGGQILHRFTRTVLGHTPSLTPVQRGAIMAGFLGVVNASDGTASGVFAGTPLAADDIAGKTGTAQVQAAQNTSLFTSFAPASNPRYVVDCVMEDSGYGASVAAPVVREIYDQLYGLPLQPVVYTPSGSSN